MRTHAILLSFLVAPLTFAIAAEIHVSPAGNDAGDGADADRTYKLRFPAGAGYGKVV